MKILVLNCGSSSLKFQVIDMENEERIVKGNYERIGGKRSCLRLNVRGEKSEKEKAARNYEEAIKTVLDLIQDKKYGIISSLDEIGAVGHRIVHGGEKYSESVLITDEVIKEIENCIPLAPLHNPEGLEGINATRKVLKDKPMVAVFDTAFHQTLPGMAYIYQIPYRYYEQYKIRKYEDLEAKKYLEKSTKYINKAIEILKDVINSGNLDENMNNDFKYDLKKWEYLSKQNNYLMNTTMARCYIDTDISKALDYYEKSVDTGEDFINLTKEYQEYIDINSIRIVQANYYKNKSDYYFLLGNKIIQEYSEDKEGNILLRAIEIMWGAYIDNIKAMEKRPEDKWVKEVADSQLEFLDKILINNKFIMKKAIYTNNKELKYHIESLKINNKDKKIIKGFVYRVVDSLILNPNFHGFGIDIKKLFSSRNK